MLFVISLGIGFCSGIGLMALFPKYPVGFLGLVITFGVNYILQKQFDNLIQIEKTKEAERQL